MASPFHMALLKIWMSRASPNKRSQGSPLSLPHISHLQSLTSQSLMVVLSRSWYTHCRGSSYSFCSLCPPQWKRAGRSGRFLGQAHTGHSQPKEESAFYSCGGLQSTASRRTLSCSGCRGATRSLGKDERGRDGNAGQRRGRVQPCQISRAHFPRRFLCSTNLDAKTAQIQIHTHKTRRR